MAAPVKRVKVTFWLLTKSHRRLRKQAADRRTDIGALIEEALVGRPVPTWHAQDAAGVPLDGAKTKTTAWLPVELHQALVKNALARGAAAGKRIAIGTLVEEALLARPVPLWRDDRPREAP